MRAQNHHELFMGKVDSQANDVADSGSRILNVDSEGVASRHRILTELKGEWPLAAHLDFLSSQQVSYTQQNQP